MAKLDPLNDRIIVRRLPADMVSAGGIALPEAQQPDRGIIVAVGPGKRSPAGERIPLEVGVGDQIVFGKYAGTTVKVEGDELLVMTEEDVFAVEAPAAE